MKLNTPLPEACLSREHLQGLNSFLLSFPHLLPFLWSIKEPGNQAPCMLTLIDHSGPDSSVWMGFSRQKYWSGLSCPPPGDLPYPDWNCISCGSCISGRYFTTEPQGSLTRTLSTVQSLSCIRLFANLWTTAHQTSLTITNSPSLLKLLYIKSVMPPNHLILCHSPLLLPSIFPASGSFQMSQLFASGGQSIGVSASTSVLTMNIQDSSALGWTGWISLQPKGLSRVFSNTTAQKHQFFSTQLSL